jgi:OmcA/MtrC family decaheme c-type cytochrome
MLRKVLLVALLITSVALVGCEGDDGDDGAPGKSAFDIAVENGFTGTEEEFANQLTGQGEPDLETCGVCHNSVAEIHELTDVSTVSNVSSAIDGAGNLVITFDVELDGVPSNDFTKRSAYVHYDDPTQVFDPDVTVLDTATLRRDTITGAVTVANDPAVRGRYTATVPAANVIANSTYLVQLQSAVSNERPVIVVENGTPPTRDLVTDSACQACHEPFPAWNNKFFHYAVGGSNCQICHVRGGRTTGYISRDPATGNLFVQHQVDADNDGAVDEDPIVGSNLTEYIHGIHNSHNMPEETFFRTTADDTTANIEDRWSIGFPSDMRNCSVCHRDEGGVDRNEIVASMPPSYYLCFSCHNSWDNFSAQVATGGPLAGLHQSLGPNANCTSFCHEPGGIAASKDEAADFHDEFVFDSHTDSFFRGEDISFTNPDDVSFAIDSVTADGSNVSFTWTASKNGAPVDPCNTDLSASPTYQELGAYLAYAKGDDWVNEFVGANPGQPEGAQDLFGELTTTCAANVATTTGLVMDPEALAYADKVLLAIGGKPADRLGGVVGQDYFVREPSPTLAFNPADGSAATPRRMAVDNDKCLGCHQGTLYQHGGDRVDNEQLCVICHNPSSGDKHNRKERFAIVNADGSVNTDATYDGKVNETFDMRHMIHSIHGVSKRVLNTTASAAKPWTIYRSRGIFVFAPPLFEQVETDDGEGGTEISTIEVDYPFPEGWPEDGETIFGSTNDSTIAHNFIVVHYPQPPNRCMACHNEEAFEVPDQSIAVPLTVDPVGPDYEDQSDDIVIGPAAAACTACHAEADTRVHATQDFGYRTNVEKEVMLEKGQL